MLMILPDLSAQKPVIDLLPADHKHVSQDPVADTGVVGDSLIKVFPMQKGQEAPGQNPAADTIPLPEKIKKKKSISGSGSSPSHIPSGIVSLIVKSTRFFTIYITALKH
jgi:hypothetical protein